MRRILSLLLLGAVLAVTLLTSVACGPSATDSPTYDAPAPDGTKHTVVIEVKKYGKITIELYEKYAPETVANFLSLAEDGFYDGLIFHRVISGFMIQGGDPLGTGTGGSDTDIKGEFSNNDVYNPLTHERGVISMARNGSGYESYITGYGLKLSDLPAAAQEDIRRAYNSASSQFFICHDDAPHLDGNYAAFGRVISGMDVVDEIAALKTDTNDKPLTTVTIKRVYIVESAD